MDEAIPITRAEFAAKFGTDIGSSIDSEAPIPITRAEYAAKFAPSTLDTINAVSGQLGKGASFGFMDELQGYEAGARNALAGLFGSGNQKSFEQNYAEEVAKARAEDAAFEAANPIGSTVLQLGGAIIPGLATGGATFAPNVGSKAAQGVATNLFGIGLGAKPTVTQLAKLGAVGSGLYGAGTATEGNRLESAVKSAALGGTIVPAASKGIGAVSNLVGNYSDDIYKSLVGYSDEAKTGIAQFLDESGNVVSRPTAGGSQVGVTDKSVQDLFESGFGNQIKITDTPKSVANKLSIFKDNVGKELGNTVDEAAKIEQRILSSENLAPWQKEEIFTLGSPTFEKAKEFVADVTLGDPALGRKLSRSLNNVEKAWNNSDKSLSALKNIQETYGRVNSSAFKKKAMPNRTESFSDELTDLIYGDLAGSIKKRIGALGEDTLLEKFSLGNKAYGAAKAWENKAFNASRKGAISKLGTELGGNLTNLGKSAGAFFLSGVPGLGTLTQAERLLAATKAVVPVQTAKAASGVSKLFGAASSPNLIAGLSRKSGESSSTDSTFSLPTQGPTVMPKADDIDLDSIPKKKADRVAYVESLIDSDPIDSAIYEIESMRDPLAVPRDKKTGKLLSSAKGAFQLIDKTAKKLGVEDPFDIAQNYKGYLKLKEEHQGVLRKLGIDENDPEALYSLHYLGSPTFKKLFNGQPLTEKEAGHVRYLESKVLPRFRKVYQSKLTNV